MPVSAQRPPVISIFLAASLFSARGLAAPTSPCEALDAAPLVFVGTATEIGEYTKEGVRTDQITIDRAFKGDLKKTIELIDGGEEVQVGKQYLIYAIGRPNRARLMSGNSSRPIEDAREDLDFLDQYVAGNLTPRIEGTIRFAPDDLEERNLADETYTPMRDVQVTLSGNGKQFQTTTDMAGRYSLSHLPPGNYKVDIGLFGFWPASPPDGLLRLPANRCFTLDVLMEIDRRIEGFVRDDNGVPVRGARVQVVPTGGLSEQSLPSVVLDFSDENGHYTLHGVPPGDYYLGVNIASIPTKEHPYPATYYPNTPDPGQAIEIGVGKEALVQSVDLQIPPQLPLVTIRGRVQIAGGQFPRDPQVWITEPGKPHHVTTPIKIGSDGRFQVELCEGVRYGARALSSTPTMRSGPTVEFTATQQNDEDELVLPLDKTLDQVSPAFSK